MDYELCVQLTHLRKLHFMTTLHSPLYVQAFYFVMHMIAELGSYNGPWRDPLRQPFHFPDVETEA